MSFFVDIVSEDSFYENLTLGVSRLLESNPCVRSVQLERRAACDRAALSTWEQKHCCLLTEDLRNFYTSTDGFLLTWSLEIAGEEFPIGRMEIKELSCLKRHVGSSIGSSSANPTSSSTSSSTSSVSSGSSSKEQQADGRSTSAAACSGEAKGNNAATAAVEPTFGGSRCKLFDLAECGDCRVFLAYQLQPDQDEPSVWLHNFSTNKWYLLSDSFVKYFRMMLVHLGLPMWQICAAGLQLPTWLEQVYLLVGPHLLKSTNPPTLKGSTSVESSLWNDGPLNAIDPMVLKLKDHHHHGGIATSGASGGNNGTITRQKTNNTNSTATTSSSSTKKKSTSSSH